MNRSTTWRRGALTGLTAIALLLTGCAAPEPDPAPPFTELTNPQTGEDTPLDGLPNDTDPDSVRHVGTHDEFDFYLAISTDPDSLGDVCVIMSTPGVDGNMSGCGGAGATEFTVGWDGYVTAEYRPPASAGLEIPDGWSRISDNVIVLPAG